MVKKRVGRSVKRNKNITTEPEEFVQAPHSFVIHRGASGGRNLLELTKDFRKVMEPFTASSLKERKKNTIKDFVSIAGLLHVSHLSIFSETELGMYLKVCRLPRGPTLTFRINNFSLGRDVVSSLKKQMVVEKAFKHSPLIIMNNFSGEELQMKLMTSMFQNMFPTINLTTVDLNTIRRCVLMNYNPSSKLIEFRHYNIKVIPVGVSKGVKKVVQGKVPDLSRFTDMDEFLTKAGLLSESEVEDDPNNHVVLSQKLASRGNMESGKSSIRLSELGPRLTLQLIKIEDGLLDGEVLFHDLVSKSDVEKLELQKKNEAKKKLKAKRRKTQEENKIKKEEQKKELKEKSLKGMQKKVENNDPEENNDTEKNKIPEDDDREYYREEVGEEPDKDLFMKTGNKRPTSQHHSFQNRKRKFEDNRSFTSKNEVHGQRDSKFKKKKYNSLKGDTRNVNNRDFRPVGGNKFDQDSKFNNGKKFGHDSKFKNGKKFDQDSKFNNGKKFGHDSKFKNGKKFGHNTKFNDGKKFGQKSKHNDGKKFSQKSKFKRK